MTPTSRIGLASLMCCLVWVSGMAFGGSTNPKAAARAGSPSSAGRAAEPAADINQIRWQVYAPAGGSSASASSKMNSTTGQAVAGVSSSATVHLRSGFWQQLRARCPIVLTGDVNLTSSITSADIIFLVNHVFKGAPAPQPCAAAGDVNCSGGLSSSDIIYLVNHVFKGGDAPCDGCTSSLATGC